MGEAGESRRQAEGDDPAESVSERFFALDEALQLTPQEARTVVTWMSRGSKLVRGRLRHADQQLLFACCMALTFSQRSPGTKTR